MDLLADFLHFGTSVFLLHVGLEQCEVWGVKSAVWSVKEAVGSEKCEVWSVKCEVWSVKFKFGVRRAQCEVWSVKCEVWSVKEAVRSEKCGVWSVKCGVWSLKFGVRRVQCAVWGVECRGKDTVGTGCLWTIGHLFLGNFRRRLAPVYVKFCSQVVVRGNVSVHRWSTYLLKQSMIESGYIYIYSWWCIIRAI